MDAVSGAPAPSRSEGKKTKSPRARGTKEMPTRRMDLHRGDGEVWARGTDERMAHGKLKTDAKTRETDGVGTTKRVVWRHGRCWRCAVKTHAPHYRRLKRRLLVVAPRRKAGHAGALRLSQSFRTLCRHCDGWRRASWDAPALKEAGARVPRRRRRRAAIERAEEKRDPYEAYEPPEITPVDDAVYAVDPNKDPLRDFTYWVQHEQTLKKGKP